MTYYDAQISELRDMIQQQKPLRETRVNSSNFELTAKLPQSTKAVAKRQPIRQLQPVSQLTSARGARGTAKQVAKPPQQPPNILLDIEHFLTGHTKSLG